MQTKTLTFYAGHTDIYKMSKCADFCQFKKKLNKRFNPPYFQITIPLNIANDVLNKSKSFIIDQNSIHTPSEIVEISCKGMEYVYYIDVYGALSYKFKKGILT